MNYCSLNSAYGSSLLDSDCSDESDISSLEYDKKKKKKNNQNHRYYVEQFMNLQNETKESDTYSYVNKVSVFNDVMDHIKKCDSCKLFLEHHAKNKNNENDKNKKIPVKNIFFSVISGLVFLTSIELIVRISN